MSCAPLTQTRRHFVPNRRQPFYWGPVSVRHRRVFSDIQTTQFNSPHKLCPPPHPCSTLRRYWSWSTFREPYNCPPPRTRGFVFPSFTYLTAAMLSFVVFLFPFFISFEPQQDSGPPWLSAAPLFGTFRIGSDQLDLDRAVPLWLEVSC